MENTEKMKREIGDDALKTVTGGSDLIFDYYLPEPRRKKNSEHAAPVEVFRPDPNEEISPILGKETISDPLSESMKRIKETMDEAREREKSIQRNI